MHNERNLMRWKASLTTLDNRIGFVLVFFVHISLALLYKEIVGVNIEADPERNTWDWFWQTLPIESLRFNLWESIWNLHSQPPLYNLYGAFFAKVCYPNHLGVNP